MLINNLKLNIKNYLITNFGKLIINSKNIKKGDVFIALQGKNTHGNDFVEQALINGAKYIITDKEIICKKFHNILVVDDIYNYLLTIANLKRNKFEGKIIAITGSVGKTSVKEHLKYFLSTHGNISTAIKSYNNYLGILISLINIDLHSIFAIFEIGTNNFNEIKKLTSIVMPHQVIITNISPTHLENLKTTRNVAIEKSDIFNPRFNPNIELLILPNSNDDEDYLNKLSKKYKISSVITFGKNDEANYCLQNIEVENNFLSKIKIKTPDELIEFQVSTSFEHQIFNIIISLIILTYNKLSINNFVNKALNISLVEGRGRFHKLKVKDNNVTLIDESYNASPVSMKNCINYFENFSVEKNQRKILILGEMNELGKFSFDYHKEVVACLLKTSINKVIYCGNLYKKILNDMNYNSKKVLHLSNEVEIFNFLENKTHNNDIILAKGSNSTKINILVKKLLKIKKVN